MRPQTKTVSIADARRISIRAVSVVEDHDDLAMIASPPSVMLMHDHDVSIQDAAT